MKTLRQLAERLAFTRTESTALVVIASLYLLGFTWRYIQQTTAPFDTAVYAELDSLIAAGGLVPVDTLPKPTSNDSLGADSLQYGKSDLIDVNQASMTELITLPGIGPALARRIMDYRARLGPFEQVADLIQVKGIGPAKLKKIEGLITIQ